MITDISFFLISRMLEDDSYNDIVSWGINGDSFVVKVFIKSIKIIATFSFWFN
jgi:hypothetical protein